MYFITPSTHIFGFSLEEVPHVTNVTPSDCWTHRTRHSNIVSVNLHRDPYSCEYTTQVNILGSDCVATQRFLEWLAKLDYILEGND